MGSKVGFRPTETQEPRNALTFEARGLNPHTLENPGMNLSHKDREVTQFVVQMRSWDDIFEYHTLSVCEWLAKHDGLHEEADLLIVLGDACAIMQETIFNSEGLQHPVSVGYDFNSEQYYFVFQVNTNGAIYILSRRGLSLEDADTVEL